MLPTLYNLQLPQLFILETSLPRQRSHNTSSFGCFYLKLVSIQDFDTIVSSEISLEMVALNVCKDSLISMVIETFDRLRPGLNSFHGELLLIGSPHKR